MSRLQTNIDENIIQKATQIFREFGMTLNDGIRFLLTGFVNGKIDVNVSTQAKFPPEYISQEEEEELAKLIAEYEKEKKQGKVLVAHSAEEHFKHLEI